MGLIKRRLLSMTFNKAIHMRKVLLLCVGLASLKMFLFTKIIFASPSRSLLSSQVSLEARITN